MTTVELEREAVGEREQANGWRSAGCEAELRLGATGETRLGCEMVGEHGTHSAYHAGVTWKWR